MIASCMQIGSRRAPPHTAAPSSPPVARVVASSPWPGEGGAPSRPAKGTRRPPRPFAFVPAGGRPRNERGGGCFHLPGAGPACVGAAARNGYNSKLPAAWGLGEIRCAAGDGAGMADSAEESKNAMTGDAITRVRG